MWGWMQPKYDARIITVKFGIDLNNLKHFSDIYHKMLNMKPMFPIQTVNKMYIDDTLLDSNLGHCLLPVTI